MTHASIALHGIALSGHTHRVETFLCMLGLPYHMVDAPAAVRSTPEFRALNPLGEIPVIVDGDVVLADSSAILVYLAKRYAAGTSWLPEDPVGASRVQRWLAIAAAQLRYGPAAARVMMLWRRPGDLAQAQTMARDLFTVMDGHLADREYLASEQPTIADVACYAYVAHAPEGGVSLEPYPAVRRWLSRVAALPGFKPMARSAVPEAAKVGG